MRRAGDVAAQASSAFHRVQGSTPAQIASLNGAIARLHGSRGRAYSFQIAQEEISEASLTRLAHWLGFPSCAYTRVPRANDGSVGGEYHTDAGAVGVSCEHATSAAEPTATTAEPSIADLTFGIKHTAGFLERRGHLPFGGRSWKRVELVDEVTACSLGRQASVAYREGADRLGAMGECVGAGGTDPLRR